MKAGTPFRAAIAYAAALAALAQQHPYGTAMFTAGVRELGDYAGRGKGKTRRHDRGGTRAAQRAAMKTRNRAKHRRACRG